MIEFIQVLSRSLKKEFNVVLSLSFINLLLDLFTLGSLYPLILVILHPTPDTWISSFLPGNHKTSLVIFILLIILLLVIKNIVSVKIAVFKSKFALKVTYELTHFILKDYVNKSYYEYVNSDSSKGLNRLANIPFHMANDILIPALHVIPEALLLLVLVSLITWYNVYIVIMLIPVIVISFFWYQHKRREFKNINSEIRDLYPLYLKKIGQLLEGLPEILVFKKEDFFVKGILSTNVLLGNQYTAQRTIQFASARVTESISIGMMCSLLIYTTLADFKPNEIVTLLGLFGIVAFKALPSLSTIFSAMVQIKTHQYAIEEIKHILQQPGHPYAENPVTFAKAIVINEVAFSYTQRPVLTHASLTIGRGEKIAIVGPSGSGKTTLLLLLLGFLKPKKGDITIDGIQLDSPTVKGWQELISYVPQNPVLLDTSFLENIVLDQISSVDHKRLDEILQTLNLKTLLNDLPTGLQTKVGEHGIKISGGQRQRLAIARAL